jgi:hypothetical protein
VDLHARAWWQLDALCDPADIKGAQALLSAGSVSFDATSASRLGAFVALMRSSSQVSNFTPSSRGLRHITRQRRRAEPFSARNRTKLSGIASESGTLIRAPIREISNTVHWQRSPSSGTSHASNRIRWRLAFRLSPRISPHHGHIWWRGIVFTMC